MNTMTRRTWLAGAAAAAVRLPRKFRLALIGLDGHTGEFLDYLGQLPDVELVAAADNDEKLLGDLPKGRKYTDWRQLLDREKPDVVGVAGPSALHAPVIVACAERKIHVVSEKPIAITRAALNDIKQAVAKNGIHLSMLLPMRFEPPYLAMHQIVASGEIGEVAQIGAQKSYKLQERPEWMRNHATFGGIMPYIGIHMVDLMRFASGRELVEACSFQSRIGFGWLRDFENTSSTVFKLDNGGTAALRMDYLRPEISPTHGDDRLRIAGTKGVVEYQEAAGLSLVTDAKKLHKVDKLPPKQSLFVDFMQSLCGIKPHSLPLSDIYRVSEICLGARESAERHSIVKLI